jgi:hypothetical protein
MELFGSGVFFK